MSNHKKQLPLITSLNRPFWEAARRYELVIYRCVNCGACNITGAGCVNCAKPDMAWSKASGCGEVFTFCVYQQGFHPAWQDDIPYNVAYVKLDEGPLLITNIIGCCNEDIYIGMPVEVVFEDINEEISLPKFRPIRKIDG